jgi:predicted DNA-binding protein (UPF0251 family)
MARPRLCRRVGFNPNITYFKPRGIPLRELEEVVLSVEDLARQRLKQRKNLKTTTKNQGSARLKVILKY